MSFRSQVQAETNMIVLGGKAIEKAGLALQDEILQVRRPGRSCAFPRRAGPDHFGHLAYPAGFRAWCFRDDLLDTGFQLEPLIRCEAHGSKYDHWNVSPWLLGAQPVHELKPIHFGHHSDIIVTLFRA